MGKLYKKLEKKNSALSLRERVLFLLTILAGIYYSWEVLFLDNITEMHNKTHKQYTQTQKTIETMQVQIKLMQQNNNASVKEALEQRLKELKEENISLEEDILEVTKQLIPPDQMSKLLTDILEADQGVTVTKVANLPEEPVFAEGEENTSKKLTNLQVYRHGLVLEFKGTYFGARSFLKKLEELPWRLVWGEMEYEVSDYPEAAVKLVIYTLSLQEEWMGI